MRYGTKADNLIKLRHGYPKHVPPFEIVPFQEAIVSYKKVIKRINNLVTRALEQDVKLAHLEAEVNKIASVVEVNNDVVARYHKTIANHGWTKVSIRTSALSEDGANYSFAGQYTSFVDVTYSKHQLEKYIAECFRSLFSVRVIMYAKKQGLKTFIVGGAAIVQHMFYGQKSGVLFTEDGQGRLVFAIASSWRNTTVEGHDAQIIKIPKLSLDTPKTARQLRHIGTIGIELEKQWGQALDIEWAYNSQQIMLLQMRPQTAKTTHYTLTWDGTNISENYPGITLPLTYSFIRNLYAHVYPSFFRLMGLSEKQLQQNSWIFTHALGYINGRVYYRIDNWYELVRLIPGKRNQEFFEAMLNPAAKRAKQKASTKVLTVLDPRFWRVCLRFIWLLLRSSAYSRNFRDKFATTFQKYSRLNWSFMTAEAILDHLQQIRAELLVMWGVPILNDVRVMIFHGILKTVVLKNKDTDIYLHYLKGLTDRASIKPLLALHALGKSIQAAMSRTKVSHIKELQTTEEWRRIKAEAEAFIKEFGGRTPDELQLENPRLGENIWDVLHLAYAGKEARLPNVANRSLHLGSVPLRKRFLAHLVVKVVREAIDYRERFRFNRAQVFGIARAAYLALGERLAEAKVIDMPQDIFWLTEQEVEQIVHGHSWSYNLQEVVAGRKRDHDAYNKKTFWLRIAGTGVVAPKVYKKALPKPSFEPGFSGQGVSPGKVSAPVVVVKTFDPQCDVTGKILVVTHVDPGWTLLLVQAAGVITEQGNPLSHVAIVAREMSIPAIVGVKDAINRFTTGQTVTIDGTTGEIVHAS